MSEQTKLSGEMERGYSFVTYENWFAVGRYEEDGMWVRVSKHYGQVDARNEAARLNALMLLNQGRSLNE